MSVEQLLTTMLEKESYQGEAIEIVDNLRGKHEIGFKELSWNKKTLDEFIRRSKHEK